jgi:capsular polysaccharide transport system permease protein
VDAPAKLNAGFGLRNSSHRAGTGVEVAQSITGQLSVGQALREQRRIIFALILRQIQARSSESRLGYVWEILQPTLIIVGLSMLMDARRGVPPVGTSYPMFLATGYLPFKAFMFISNDMRKSLGRDSKVLDLPAIHNLDSVIATLVLRVLTTLVIVVSIIALINAIGFPAIPDDPLRCLVVFGWLAVFAFGFGLVVAVLTEMMPTYKHIHSILSFKLLFISGVFFLPETMPPELRYYLAYNPLLHVVSWFRSAFIPGFESQLLDRGYLITWACVSLVLGLLLVRTFRSRLTGEDEL